ncbi:Serine/threonine protein kinase [Handroanthus impetiginosus]|uniref:Receptor-like serine/threonine-protein kinase n=1 Tax=Handroanthus impetiginosus TaxID=429701 RepID=A0A2G9G9M9_9LAMI|nr:Serine/threonine protein kinase [Handroanthus impetiginosus]
MSLKNICNMSFFLTILCLCVNSLFSHAADTISANQSLSGDQTIVSSGGIFELGFFSPGNSSKYYIGIWYKRIPEKAIVWVANREIPISNKDSAQLRVLDGNLVLLNESQIKIWSTDLTSTASNSSVIAVLLDNGNLILREKSGSNSTLWESFNNPSDTWMPGAKIGYDKRTKRGRFLTSWKNSEDPAPGLFSDEFDPNGTQYVMMWNRSKQYWTSGSWDGHRFSLIPEMGLFRIYNFTYVDNENESYFTFTRTNPSTITRFNMDVSGRVKQRLLMNNESWNVFGSQPRQQCEVYAYCGAFGICNQDSLPFCSCLPGFKIKHDNDWSLMDYSAGCVREISLQCENNGSTSNEKNDKFLMNSNLSLPLRSQLLTSGSIGECEGACLSNCSCSAYAYDGSQCSLWNGELFNLQQLAEGDGSGKDVYVRLSASSSLFVKSKNDKQIVIGSVVGSVVAVLVILAIVFAVVFSRRRLMAGKSKVVEGFLVAFGYKDLQNATKNFSEKLGGGGFGSVYKGTLPDSTVVAVKKLESVSQGEKQFRAEVSTIGIIQHVNLVRLRGFCVQGNNKMLVYDYMQNGSLDSHLFDVKKSNILKWKTRYQIALGVAKGLAYLHENCKNCIIHFDVKPENVLLDNEFCPKVADFGLAKLLGGNFSRVLTTMRGTIGYLAPEWISGVEVTAKADVYSYGMMLFELVSGKRNTTNSEDENVRYFPYWAASVTIEGGDILDLLDPVLEREGDIEEVSNICKVACWCVQGDASVRPSMGQVVQILEGVMDVNLPPLPRWLQVLAETPAHSALYS